MSVSRRCVELRAIVSPLVRVCALGAALLAGGCASDQEHRQQAYSYGQQAYYAQAQAPRQRPAEQELEDDGLPSQVPPPMNRRREADDPSEPYSPNYGMQRHRADATIAPAPVPPAIPVATRPQRIASY